MRNDMNLATHPFGRSRLFWLASCLAAVGLIAGAVVLAAEFRGSGALPPELLQTRQKLQQQLQELAAEEGELRGRLGDPLTVDVYDRSHFLNQLLTRKGVSWTRTFADLETILPPRVLMMQVRPEVTFTNDVQLEMQVGAETWDDFIAFVSALEASDKFRQPNVRGYSPPTERTVLPISTDGGLCPATLKLSRVGGAGCAGSAQPRDRRAGGRRLRAAVLVRGGASAGLREPSSSNFASSAAGAAAPGIGGAAAHRRRVGRRRPGEETLLEKLTFDRQTVFRAAHRTGRAAKEAGVEIRQTNYQATRSPAMSATEWSRSAPTSAGSTRIS